ncbi:carbonic anhydrase [Hyphomonas sp.]|jgi:carbonic anhydrase|uniref:carbonic anhydrase n=1 Tax=Hyphomonas sp. TaxID=87 RepID=UPI000C6903E8|nr:carbonic anhydrase [Hyphomonas sp.]MBM56437.1 carbonic anhydrase [Hyphomonas sp.]
MPRFAAGVVRFKNSIYPEKQDLFEELSKGQSPEALFIACSDSRVETAMITQTEPGELFICRNAGNIVPPHTESTGGMTASIEYAVAVLKVPHIVVCGHTECGAMKGAMNPEGLEGLPHVAKWLGYSKAAVDIVDGIAEDDASPDERMKMLIEQNVLLQLQHLRTHPSVAAALAKGTTELHGWVYDIRSGEVEAWDEAEGKFITIDSRYAAQIRELAGEHTCAA